MATTAMMRVRKDIHEMLHDLAEQENTSMQEVLTRALEAYRRQRLIEETNRGYAALRADQDAWRAVEAERAALDSSLMDGLTRDPEFAGW